MRKRRFCEAQNIEMLRQADAGMKVVNLRRQHGISDATFYKCRSNYGGLGVSEAVWPRQLEEENRRLKRLVADQALDSRCSKRCLEKPIEPAERRQAVRHVSGHTSIPSGWELAEERGRFGSLRLNILLRREGWPVNHKHVERIYREEGRSQRLKRRRTRTSHLLVVAARTDRAEPAVTMGFISGSLENAGGSGC